MKDYPEEGLATLSEHLEKSRKTRHLTSALKAYKTFASIDPERRGTWNCSPTTYTSVKRLNEEARVCYQQLQRQKRDTDYHQHYHQGCLDLVWRSPYS